MENKTPVKWYWLSKSNNNDYWLELSPKISSEIEEEYQRELSGKRGGCRVFHCFGNGWSAEINYRKMETQCASGRCMLTHKRNGLSDNHMTFKVKRVE